MHFRKRYESLSPANYLYHGISRRLSNAGNPAISGVFVSHTTIMRWVLRYVPEYERRWKRFARPVNSSWRMDETAVSVRGDLHYLYRAVDKRGKTVASLLRADKGMNAAREFFCKAVAINQQRWPRKGNL